MTPLARLKFTFCAALVFLISAGQHAGAAPTPAPAEAALASPIQVEAIVDPQSATVGDLIAFAIKVLHDPDMQVSPPNYSGILEGLEFVDKSETSPRQVEGKIEREFSYRWRADQVGTYQTPNLSILFKVPDANHPDQKIEGNIKVPSIKFEVKSVLNLQGEPKDIRDIKTVVDIPQKWPWHLLGPLLALLALAAALFIQRKRGSSGNSNHARPLLPHEVALRELEILRKKQLLERGAVQEHYFQLSEIFRRYLGARFGVPAMDWTTEEIAGNLDRLEGLSDSLKDALVAILGKADRVKFAKAAIDDRLSAEIMDSIVRFVQTTKFIPEEPREFTPSALGP